MSKILTSIFLTIATLMSGLVMASPSINVSAFPADTLRCTPAGQFIDASSAGRECIPCPVDYYCPAQTRTGLIGLYSPEKPGKDGKPNSEVIPCPSGTTTIGNTRNPARGYSLMTKDEDGFKVGTLALDPSECKPRDFVCKEPTPVKTAVNNILGCYSRCENGTTEVIKNNVRSCIAECRDDAIIAFGKCFDPCPNGAVLTIVDGVANCNNKCLTSPIRGQIVGPKGNCICPAEAPDTILDQDSPNTGRCGKINVTTSSSSTTSVSSSSNSSVTPPVNCTVTGAVRNNGTCVCPTGTYAVVMTNGSKTCTTCLAGNTIETVGVESTGEITYKCTPQVVTPPVTPPPATNNGGDGFCGGFWIVVCGLFVGGLIYDIATPCEGIINFGCNNTPAPIITAEPGPTIVSYEIGPKPCPQTFEPNGFDGCSCPFPLVQNQYRNRCESIPLVEVPTPGPSPRQPEITPYPIKPKKRSGPEGTGFDRNTREVCKLGTFDCVDGDVKVGSVYPITDYNSDLVYSQIIDSTLISDGGFILQDNNNQNIVRNDFGNSEISLLNDYELIS